MSIEFYSHKKKHGYMSNFYPSPICINNVTYPTTEHYFQASKMTNNEDHESIRMSNSPYEAARLGRKLQMRNDWFQVRDAFMLEALRYKFHQHTDLFNKLVSTGTSQLVEHTKNDSYWGDGGDGTGHNMLGNLLMVVRADCQFIYSLGFVPLNVQHGVRLYYKYHGLGYYQVIIDWLDNTYQLLLCGGNNDYEVISNQDKLERYLTQKGSFDILLTYNELVDCVRLTQDSTLCTQSCSDILSSR